MNNELEGIEGEVRFTVGIVRKATGKTETYEMVGKIVNEPEKENVSDTQHISEGRSD